MGLDIRFPVGMIFSVLGLILLIYGAVTNHDAMYMVSTNININMIWGAAMLVFGVATFGLARRRAQTVASMDVRTPPESSHTSG